MLKYSLMSHRRRGRFLSLGLLGVLHLREPADMRQISSRLTEAGTGGARQRGGATGVGGDNGIAHMWNRREISASADHDQSLYLHPHPYWIAVGAEP